MQHDHNGCTGRKLGDNRTAGEGVEIKERRPLVGNYLNCTGDHQPAGRPEKAADHRIGNETNCATGIGIAENTKQPTGERRRERQGDERRLEEMIAAIGDETLDQRGHHRGEHDGNGTVRSGNGEGNRAAQRHDGAADRGRQECDGNAVSQQVLERTGEDECRVRQAIGDR